MSEPDDIIYEDPHTCRGCGCEIATWRSRCPLCEEEHRDNGGRVPVFASDEEEVGHE